MNNIRTWLLLLAFSPVQTWANDVMFEGYFKMTLDEKPIGFLIQRYEFDAKKRQFKAISFMQTQIGESSSKESLSAVANDKFQPLSYQYTVQDGKTLKMIDATFKGEVMTLKVSDGTKVRNETHKHPKGTFLSSFLLYMILQKELKPGVAYSYSAVAEEDGDSFNGKYLIDQRLDKDGFKEFRIINNFKNDKFITTVAAVPDQAKPDRYQKAELIAVDLPAKRLKINLKATPVEATQGHVVPNKTLLTLFTVMPTGRANLLSKVESSPAMSSPAMSSPATSPPATTPSAEDN
jgi:hypothetical protein